MHGEYTQVPFSSHTHYHTSVHSLLQLICILFCSQGNNKNHRERKRKESNLTNSDCQLQMLKKLHPKQNSFFILGEIQCGGHQIRHHLSGLHFIYVCYKSTRHIQHHYQSTFSSFIQHSAQLVWELTENKNSVPGCKTAAQSEFFPYKKRHPL